MIRRSLLLILLLPLTLAALSCTRSGSGSGMSAVGDGPSASNAPVESVEYEVDDYIEGEWPPFALSEGQPDWDAGEARPPLAQTTLLTPEQLQTLLGRLPPVQEQEGDVEQVRLPDQILPPPRPGVEGELPFPPPQASALPDDLANTPLAVLRFSPEGDVQLVPPFSITFNQPMVPLTSHQELGHKNVPAILSPEVPGRWRWVGTKTLLFEADLEGPDRMPMATEYTVEIPAGTKSVSGQKLAEPVSWAFQTPPPTLQLAHPTSRSLGVAPVFFASFDQKIDPTAVIEHAQVTARAFSYTVRLSTPRARAALTKPSLSSTPWLLASMALMFCLDSGSRRITVTAPSGETSFNASLSVAAIQSAHRQDSRKRGHPRRSSFFRMSSSGVRPSSVPARDSSSPSRKSVMSCHSGLSSKV